MAILIVAQLKYKQQKYNEINNYITKYKKYRLTVLDSGFFPFLNVTYDAIEEESGTGDLVLGGTMPTG